MQKTQKGISLIQLLAIIVILSVLSMMTLPNIKNISNKARISTALENKLRVQQAVDRYYLNNNCLPVKNLNDLKPGLPQQINWELLTPNYLNKAPEDIDRFYYWIDFMGTVWVSDIDSPLGVQVLDNGNGSYTVEWNAVPNAISYKIGYIKDETIAKAEYDLEYINANTKVYEWLKEVSNIQGNKGQVIINNVQEDLTKKIVVVTALSKKGFKSVPVKSGYVGYDMLGQFFHIKNINLNAFNKVWYVSPDGNNSNEGTKESPFLTVDKAIREAQSGDAIYITQGEYKLNQIIMDSYYRSVGITDFGKQLTFIGEGKNTVLSYYGGKSPRRDGNFFELTNPNTKVIGIYFKFYPGKYTNYSNAIFRFCNANFYNSYFEIMDTGHSASYNYYNSNWSNYSYSKPNIYNSIFYFHREPVSNYSGNPHFWNSISNTWFGGTSHNSIAYKSVPMSNIENLKTDDSVINKGTDGTDIGVYGGEYPWNE